MAKIAKHWGGAAMLSLCALSGMKAAFAAPPVNPKGAAHPELRAELRAPLDLRPPAPTVFDSQKTTAAFTALSHRQSFGALGSSDGLQASDGRQGRIPGRVEEFARRVHQEGLPVARLWQNKSALLSLGLNQKGKPGLWIVQKVR